MADFPVKGHKYEQSGFPGLCNERYTIYIILLYPDERRPTTVRSNDTLVDTPFQLISGFFHVNQGILCSEHAEQASSRGVLERGGGNNRKWIETD